MSRKGSKSKEVTLSTKRKLASTSTGSSELDELIARASNVPATKGRWYLHDAISHLVKAEPRFTELFLKYDLPAVYLTETGLSEGAMPAHNWEDPPFAVLTQIIVYQQLSGASARSVWRKFLLCFNLTDGKNLTPQMIRESNFSQITDEEGKRKILINEKPSGLSASKAKYIQSLTDAFLDDNLLKNIPWSEASDEVLHEKLIAVKGLGVWSVQMFMMFALHRPNILPLGDLAIRRALCNFLNYPKGHLENKQNLKKIEEVCVNWSPYASFASFYLWKFSVEPTPIKEKRKLEEISNDQTEGKPKKKPKAKK